MSATSVSGRRAWGDATDIAIAVAAAIHLALPWILGHLPYQDIANHLARYTLLDRGWSGAGAPWIDASLAATPYIAVDILGAGLVHLAGAHLAARLLATLALGIIPLGMYVLLRVVAPSQRQWTLVAILLSASPFFLKGLVNYQIGVGALLLWAAAWWPRRERTTVWGRVALVAGITLLTLIHLSSAAVALLLTGVDALAQMASAARSAPLRTALRQQAGRLTTAAGCSLAFLLLVRQMQESGPSVGGADATLVFHSALQKLVSLSEPFYTLTPWEAGLTAVPYLLALAALLRVPGASLRPNPFRTTTLLLAMLYLVTPESIGGAGHLDVRWLLPMYLLAFVTMPGADAPAPPAARRLLWSACVLHAVLLLGFGVRIDRELDDYDALLARLPAGARVLPLVGGPPHYARVEPYLHYALWRTTDTGSRVGGLFSYIVEPAGRPRTVSVQFAHFRELDPSYTIFDPWRKAGSPSLPWPVIRSEYDFVIQAGADSALGSMLAEGACAGDRQGAITAYAVGAACGYQPRSP